MNIREVYITVCMLISTGIANVSCSDHGIYLNDTDCLPKVNQRLWQWRDRPNKGKDFLLNDDSYDESSRSFSPPGVKITNVDVWEPLYSENYDPTMRTVNYQKVNAESSR